MSIMNTSNFARTAVCLVFSFSGICASHAEPGAALINPTSAQWSVKPLLDVGQHAANAYRMVGIPDGLGAFRNADGTMTVLMNHELGKDKGIKRLHGANGAFVSRWTFDVENLNVISGQDLIKKVMLWSATDQRYSTSTGNQFNKLCSADLAPASAFFNPSSGKGYKERLFLNGEESKDGGRAFAHIVSGEEAGTSYELPYLGKFAWENAVANPATGDLTLVVGMDDNQDGQIYVYAGEKSATGNPVEKAGLSKGQLYAIKADGGRFSLAGFGDVSAMSGADLEKAGEQSAVSKFMRPEDGAWDTQNPNIFYFATTAKIDGESQIFRLKFDDVNHPEKGGEIKAILNAKAIGAQMFDNLTVMGNGSLLIEEDPGNHQHLAAIWLFDPKTGKAEKVLESDPKHFLDKNSSLYVTEDEENSGIIEITHLVQNASWAEKDKRYFLGVMQIHAKSDDVELVEDGQLYLVSGKVQ